MGARATSTVCGFSYWSMLLVGEYFPGGTVIFIAVILTEVTLEAAVAIGVAVSGYVCPCSGRRFGNRSGYNFRVVSDFGFVYESRFLPGCA